MTTDTAARAAIELSDLPVLGEPLEGGIFAGIQTLADSTHVAVVLLPGHAKKLGWQAAMDWAKEQGGELPSRQAAATLFANLRKRLDPAWHWTCETDEDDASYAWDCYFYHGFQYYHPKSFQGCAVAVRLIHLSV